jgi:hypothetical protein
MGTEDECQAEGQSEPPICGPKLSTTETGPAANPAIARHEHDHQHPFTETVTDDIHNGGTNESIASPNAQTGASVTSNDRFPSRPRSGSGGPGSVISSSTANTATTTQRDDDDGDTIEEGTVVGEPESPALSSDEAKAAATEKGKGGLDSSEAYTVSAETVCQQLQTNLKCVPEWVRPSCWSMATN